MRKLTLIAAIAAAALVAAALSIGSSHREAPNTANDPTADDTDVYAFSAADAPGSLTVVANWIPFEDPAGGPNFYNFDPKARYYVNVDNTGDGRADVRYRFQFKTHIRNRNSFAAALPPVRHLTDKNLNVFQTYSVTRLRYNKRGRRVGRKVIARKVRAVPSNIGPKTMPDYDTLAREGVRGLNGGGKVFAGQRDDPFFVDLGQTFDSINFRPGVGTGNQGGGKDDLAGYNTNSIVIQVPERRVTRNGKRVGGPKAANAVVGVWASTERRRLQVANGRPAGRYVQVSRLGNPLVNEVVIPLGKKDKFNRTKPHNDAKNYGRYVLKPELARLMNVLFDLGVKETNRTDIVTALLTGVPGLTQISRKPAAADTLKINLGVAPTASGNRYGVIAGDNAGFPNGRRLADDVVDVELRVIGGFLLPEDQGGKKLPLGDGVDRNDKPFLDRFPYVASPTAGYDSGPKRIEPPHDPVPGQP